VVQLALEGADTGLRLLIRRLELGGPGDVFRGGSGALLDEGAAVLRRERLGAARASTVSRDVSQSR
jgi:hypothetical protein